MRGWTFMLGGLLVWTVHFFALYAVASIFLTTPLSRGLTLGITAACLVADVLLFRRARRLPQGDVPDDWARRIALLGIAVSVVAVVWQGLPAILI